MMKKIQLLIILLVVMVLLGLTDYFVTKPSLALPSPEETHDQNPETTDVPPQTDDLKEFLEKNPQLSAYQLEKTTRSLNLFETFDLRQTSLAAYKSRLVDPSQVNPAFEIYLIQVPANQGKFSFLNLKLMMTDQLAANAEINVNNQFGQNSLFYNNPAAPSTAFLLVQVDDVLYGFQYPKTSSAAFQFIQDFIQSQTS